MYAVVGMDCLLPGALDVASWLSLETPQFRRVPDGRWPMPRSGAAGEAPATDLGAFVEGFRFDPRDTEPILPLDELDPLFSWVIHVVRGALPPGADRARTTLSLAVLGLPSTGAVCATAGPILARLGASGAVPWLDRGHPLDRWPAGAPAAVAASALGLGGEVDALDAACASGLYAVRTACDRLAAGEADLAVAAAVNRADSAYLFQGFSRLLALSRSGAARPLDARADGMLIGEGAVAVALMRLSDALREGREIHAVLRGVGIGSDGRKGNMLAPAGEGQLRAMRAAWSATGLDPATLGLVECHATGTALGDGTELRSLHALIGERPAGRVAVTSAKALVGHTVTAAGLAGLLRAIGAVRDGVLPAAIGCEQPRPELADSALLVALPAPRPWGDGVRRAAVDAFGFGGTNAHAIVERFEPGSDGPVPLPLALPRLALLAQAIRVGPERDRAGLDRPAPPALASLAITRGATAPRIGSFIEAVAVDPRRYKIPPMELCDLLPQQLLALELAADAVACCPGLDGARTATVVGFEVDPQVCEPTIRWALAAAGQPREASAVHPPLTASRVQGTLPNFVANRIAAQLDLAGPSYVVAAGPRSGSRALRHAARLLADRALDAVVVGAVDVSGAEREREAGVALVVRRLEDAERDGLPVAAVLSVRPGAPPPPLDPQRQGAADDLVALCRAVHEGREQEIGGVHVEPRGPLRFLEDAPDAPRWDRVLVVPHGLPPLPAPAFDGPFGREHLPRPRVRDPGDDDPGDTVVLRGQERIGGPLLWPVAPRPAPAPRPAAPPPPAPAQPVLAAQPAVAAPLAIAVPAVTVPPDPQIVALAQATARATRAVADAHEAFLDAQDRATAPLVALAEALARAAGASLPHAPPLPPSAPAPSTAPLSAIAPIAEAPSATAPSAAPLIAPAPSVPAPSTAAPIAAMPLADLPAAAAIPAAVPGAARPAPSAALFDREALLAHASGPLSSVFGPGYADLDRFEPRVRMPLPPLLLVDRVVLVEGERERFGRCRIVTEYDVPHGSDWTADGRPPAFVVVESGQADLFLVSLLGIDAICRGERRYRLLDCDLEFLAPRPEPGTTLRHDIRIDQFARLGATTLFYFGYDCVDAGTGAPVLRMRHGCAGFFTEAELAHPRGLQDHPRELPARAPIAPVCGPPPSALDERAVAALADGRATDALGPAFAPADGTSLRLPPDPRWRLVHRVTTLRIEGPPHGLGLIVAEQDLADEDWFNPVHFQGDPCMPGTLMLEGCLQTVQTWLLAAGAGAIVPRGRFEVRCGLPIRLRCRGQVAPGHRRLTYTARIVDAALEPVPYAVADVVLSVDGTPVVIAHDVSVEVVGERIAPPRQGTGIGPEQILEFSIGSAERAFGPVYAAFDSPQRRCPRMPGPPLLQMTEVLSVEGPMGEREEGRSATVAYDVPTDAWFWRAAPGRSLPWVILLETALQPCGWLTAWQAAGIAQGADLYFRNLGGELRVLRPVRPETGRLRTAVRQVALSASGGMQLQRFELEMRDASGVVLSGEAQFGYFSAAALAQQRGLAGPPPEALPAVQIDLRDHPALPRADLRMVDRVVAADPTGGSAGLGRYRAIKRIDPSEWFFVAHFWLDPVMPGSLGLEGLGQLARWVWCERAGEVSPTEPLSPDHPVTWTYRGQVRQQTAIVELEIEVLSIDPDGMRCRGWLSADGVPIYQCEGFGAFRAAPAAPIALPRPAPPPRVAALLDALSIDGDQAVGSLRLDPSAQPWLDQHRPTLTAAAVPMAFVAEIAAEVGAAFAARSPGLRVVGLPEVRIERWIHTGHADRPLTLDVVAVQGGGQVAVTLAVDGLPHARAVVSLGTALAEAPPEDPEAEAEAVSWSGADFFASGRTFHGPVLQAMASLDRLGPRSATATLAPRPDADLLGDGAHAFVLDPLLLDAATHPMLSGEPERWSPDIPPGRLAYPVRLEGLALHGPRPPGPVPCRIRLLAADRRALSFEVRIGDWCTYRWHEVVVPGGPVLGQPAQARRAFLWERRAVPSIRVGRPSPSGWRVAAADVIEPIEGTLAALYGAADAPDALAVLAVKEALREHLRQRTGADLHPRDLEVIELRPGTWIATGTPTLTADVYAAHLHPTRFVVRVRREEASAEAIVAAP